MKRCLTLMLVALAVTACDNNPTGADAQRYDLVEWFGRSLPAGAIVLPGGPTPACVDTLVSGYIELTSASSAARQSHRIVTNCGGQRTINDEERTGTYVMMQADTVRLTWTIGTDLIGQFTESAILAGNRLRIPYTVYTEAEPDGTEISTIYERR
jgi:hypothetical protein